MGGTMDDTIQRMDRTMELNIIGAGLEGAIATCAELEKRSGPGAILLRMDAAEEGGFPSIWRPAEELPDIEEFHSMVRKSGVGSRGRVVIILVYPARVAGYLLSLCTAPEWREMTGRNFVVMEEAILLGSGGGEPPGRPEKRPIRLEDLEQNGDFL